MVRDQKGFGFLVVILTVAIMISVFLATVAVLHTTLSDEVGRLQRNMAAQQAIQDFALMAESAFSTREINNGTCPANTVESGQFCWPAKPNRNCINHPMQGPPGTSVRRLCLDTDGSPTPQDNAFFALNTEPRQYWYESVMDDFYFVAQKIKNLTPHLLLEGVNYAVAQAGREAHLPSLGSSPSNNVTGPAAAAMVCDSSTPGNRTCKRCTSASRNMRCVRIRICLATRPCNTSSGFEGQWVYGRFGVMINDS